MNKKLLLMLNPVAGKEKGKAKLFEMVDGFSSHGYTVTVVLTSPNEAISDQVRDNAPGHDVIVTVGGDGTLNRVVNGLLTNGIELPLGYIPLGSTNDFGSSLELSSDVTEACDNIASGEVRPIDVGKFNDRYFVYIAATGMFADTSYTTTQQMKNALGHGAYLLKGIASVSPRHSTRYICESAEGKRFDCDCIFASVSNSLRAGGVLKLPKDDISFDDGLFELFLVPTPKNLFDGTVLLGDVLKADMESENFVYLKSGGFRFEFDKPHAWTLDGENGGESSEALISVVRKAIYLIR